MNSEVFEKVKTYAKKYWYVIVGIVVLLAYRKTTSKKKW